jgi:hypothetical protein
MLCLIAEEGNGPYISIYVEWVDSAEVLEKHPEISFDAVEK